ncbi:hypothetical protein [Mesorhizobium qingshengii]|jgi:hypothetical protein|uniref:hypothetical protein n=1 Tax=Mesorhizobium qingshengii TaxID=1165689 RepID=UPI0014289A6F|nr:hypothetical protein [Mesorhizobium qingshengii]
MTDKPATTYVVSVFEKPHWRTVMTTKDKAKPWRWQGDRRQGACRGDHAEGEGVVGSALMLHAPSTGALIFLASSSTGASSPLTAA